MIFEDLVELRSHLLHTQTLRLHVVVVHHERIAAFLVVTAFISSQDSSLVGMRCDLYCHVDLTQGSQLVSASGDECGSR